MPASLQAPAKCDADRHQIGSGADQQDVDVIRFFKHAVEIGGFEGAAARPGPSVDAARHAQERAAMGHAGEAKATIAIGVDPVHGRENAPRGLLESLLPTQGQFCFRLARRPGVETIDGRCSRIGRDRFGVGRPPIGNPKGRAILHQSLRLGSRPYPDTPFQPPLDLVTKSLRQNGPELVKRTLGPVDSYRSQMMAPTRNSMAM